MPTFLRIEAALSTCGSHIDSLKEQAESVDAVTLSEYAELENYLVSFLVGAIYAEFEQYVKKLILERCDKITDQGLRAFARSAVERMVKKIKISDLAGHLGYFDTSCKEAFSNAVNDPSRGQEKAAYDNLITDRHGFVHSTGISMTFEEVHNAFRASLFVLDEFEKALSLVVTSGAAPSTPAPDGHAITSTTAG
jgi:hypothetical protein